MLDKVYLRNGEYAMMWVFKEVLNLVKENGGKLLPTSNTTNKTIILMVNSLLSETKTKLK